jgi:hypothetical protein
MLRSFARQSWTGWFLAGIDKNSLWGEMNIQKGELCVKEI